MSEAISRFWFAIAAFLLGTVLSMHAFEVGFDDYEAWVTCLIAGIAGVMVQLLIERLSHKKSGMLRGLFVVVILFSCFYYVYLTYYSENSSLTNMRTSVIFFILYLASIWIPTIKNRAVSFSNSFVAFFKAHFTSFLLSFVLMIGLCLVVGAFHFLIMDIDFTIYMHIMAITWGAFFPLYFLSLIPFFPKEEENGDAKYHHAIQVPKFLEVLLSYIVVPLLVAYTLILLLYILTNITGEFWNDNLLEPLLVSYTVTGWITLFLIESVETQSAKLFKAYFPKLLLFVVLFQTASTIAQMTTFGLTQGRYFVLLYGIVSIIGAILYVFAYDKRKAIPGLLILFSILPILPYIDAVHLSVRSQENRLESVLEENGMIEGGEVQPDGSIPDQDKEVIIESIDYLNRHRDISDVDYLPDEHISGPTFTETFGFDRSSLEEVDPALEHQDAEPSRFEVYLEDSAARQINVSESDLLIPARIFRQDIYSPDLEESEDMLEFEFDGETYEILWDESENMLTIRDEIEVVFLEIDQSTLRELDETTDSREERGLEELTFTEENDQLAVELIYTELTVEEDSPLDAELYILIEFK